MKRWIMALVALGALAAGCERPVPRASGALPQEVYVWQRSWSSAAASLDSAPVRPAKVVALAAEASFEAGRARSMTVEIDWEALGRSGAAVGLAVRAGQYPGVMSEDDDGVKLVAELAARPVAAARAVGIEPGEVQIDFDCPDSKLTGYGAWLRTIRRRTGQVPLTITALPSWLSRPEFKDLAALTDGFVLQVHSLSAPRDVNDRFALCDAKRSREWIEAAAKVGRPFRVALPTYGYLVGFGADGKFIGLSAEGPGRSWPAGATVKEVRSDPAELAALVRSLTADRPANLAGIIWYRMPVAEDRLNWPWATLKAVMEGREPRASIRAEVRQTEPALFDVDLINDGETDLSSPSRVTVSWAEGGVTAADGLGGFEARSGKGEVRFEGAARLRPGERRAVGWVRLTKDQEVKVHATAIED